MQNGHKSAIKQTDQILFSLLFKIWCLETCLFLFKFSFQNSRFLTFISNISSSSLYFTSNARSLLFSTNENLQYENIDLNSKCWACTRSFMFWLFSSECMLKLENKKEQEKYWSCTEKPRILENLWKFVFYLVFRYRS